MRAKRLVRASNVVAAALAAALSGALAWGVGPAGARPLPASPLPPEVKIGATDTSGWIYTDQKGFTLYIWPGGDFPMQSNCTDERFVRATVNTSDAHYYMPDAAKRPTCVQFTPPLPAGPNARPIGDWAVIKRADGTRQWAWKGHPVYRSSLDEAPGDVNGGGFFNYLLGGAARTTRTPIHADLLGFPPGVTTEETAAGTILMAGENQPLFIHRGPPKRTSPQACSDECQTGWKPFVAPALAVAGGDWSLVTVARGLRQWAYKGQLLFTYDRVVLDPQVPLDPAPDWAPAVVIPLPQPPKAVTVQMTLEGPAYADAQGHTLYTFHCIDETPDQLECDVKGTTQKVRLSLCGGLDQCRKWFRPLYAHKGDKAPNRTWTVVKIDKQTLGRMYDERQDGLYVWAHRGRPLYTFYLDHVPGDAYAHEIQIHLAADWRMIQVGTR